MPEEAKQLVIENEAVEMHGFVIMPRGGSAYMAKSASELFATMEEAKEVLTQLVAKGMPIGMAVVREAHLKYKRHLEVTLPEEPQDDAQPSNLIILGK